VPVHHDEVLVRVPSECLTGDVFGSVRCDCGAQLLAAKKRIAEAGRGVIVHKLADGDESIGFDMVVLETDGVVVEKTTGGTARISAARYRVTGRAGRGFELTKRGGLLRVVSRPVEVAVMEAGAEMGASWSTREQMVSK